MLERPINVKVKKVRIQNMRVERSNGSSTIQLKSDPGMRQYCMEGKVEVRGHWFVGTRFETISNSDGQNDFRTLGIVNNGCG
jgi:hypothetical protein